MSGGVLLLRLFLGDLSFEGLHAPDKLADRSFELRNDGSSWQVGFGCRRLAQS